MQTPNEQETPFLIDEIFVSITDKKSLILAVNDTFVRIAGFSYEEIIGAPHNLIRHPDTPKTIFKIFWTAIQENRPIAAYIKNRSIDGRHYWVFATTWPTETGYISVRTKPVGPYFKKMAHFYTELLAIERQKGMPLALEAVTRFLEAEGFSSYQAFAQTALNQEFESRMQLLKGIPRKEGDHKHPHLSLMQKKIRLNLKDTSLLMDESVKLKSLTKTFQENTEVIQKQVKQLDTLSLNMAVSSMKFGPLGLPLAVVSAEFQLLSKRLIQDYQTMLAELPKITEGLAEFRWSIGVAYLQAELLDTYLLESSHALDTAKGLKRFWQESHLFISMIQSHSVSILEDITLKEQMLLQFERWTTSLHHQLLSLDLCRLGGSIESMREEPIEAKFRPFIDELLRCIQLMQAPLEETRERITHYKALFQGARARLQALQVGLVSLEMIRLRFEDVPTAPNQ